MEEGSFNHSFYLTSFRSVLPGLGWEDFLVLSIFSLFVYLLANVIQLRCVQVLGAPFVSTLLPWRLVAAVAIGVSPFLGEELSILNGVGCVVVFVSLGMYLYAQFRASKAKKRLLDEINESDTTSKLDTTADSDDSSVAEVAPDVEKPTGTSSFVNGNLNRH